MTAFYFRRLFKKAVYEAKTVVCFNIERDIKQWTNLGITYIDNKVSVKHKRIKLQNESKRCDIIISDHTRITRQRSLALAVMSLSVVSITKSLIELIYECVRDPPTP